VGVERDGGHHVFVNPYNLHPTPHTPHPTPYTLHPTTYTLHPTTHTLHPTTHTLHPPPYTLQYPWGLSETAATTSSFSSRWIEHVEYTTTCGVLGFGVWNVGFGF